MDWRIRRTLVVMEHHIARPLPLATLARQANLSLSRFSHLSARYLRDLRLDYALMLLYDSTLSIKEVMSAVGLNDPSHFTRDFSRRHGVSPREFRTQTETCDEQTIIDRWLSSRNGQQTAASANDPLPRGARSPSIFEQWRDRRAQGA